MDASKPVPFPEFETLPAMAQERLGGLARRYAISEQKVVMLTMLIAQGVPLVELISSCRMMELPLTMTHLMEIRTEMNEWVALEEYRRSMIARLEEAEKLTQVIYHRMVEARTRQEILAIYLEVVPFEVLEGDNRGFGEVNLREMLSEVNWLSLMNAPAKGRFKLEF